MIAENTKPAAVPPGGLEFHTCVTPLALHGALLRLDGLSGGSLADVRFAQV
jgi:hypothetical protein